MQLTIAAEERMETDGAAMVVTARRGPEAVTTTDMVLLQMVHEELKRARKQHPGQYLNPHHAHGILKEEVDEFWDEVRQRSPQAEPMLRELLQIAAVAIRAAGEVVVPKMEPMDFIRMQIEGQAANGAVGQS